MHVHIISMIDKGPIKTKQAMLRTKSNMVFFGTQGQVTSKWRIRSGQNSNSSDIL